MVAGPGEQLEDRPVLDDERRERGDDHEGSSGGRTQQRGGEGECADERERARPPEWPRHARRFPDGYLTLPKPPANALQPSSNEIGRCGARERTDGARLARGMSERP